MPHIDVSLYFMPAFYHKHLGINYGEGYYFDPAQRTEIMQAELRFLYELWGRHGLGTPHPGPATDLFVQPVDLIMHTQGAEWRFPVDATLESMGTPWAGLTPEDITRIDARAAAYHPAIDTLFNVFHELERHYGDRADLLYSRGGMMNAHTPYTTAHQLYGEELFVLMAIEPESAQLIFAKVWEIYQAIYARISEETGIRFNRIYLGDCSASLLSEAMYREVVLPVNQRLAAQFELASYHSCGYSSHLLAAFAEIPHADTYQLGAGTDLAAATRLLPGAHLQPLVDPVAMREATSDGVHALISNMLQNTATAPAVTLCAWSFDGDTPLENVETLYQVVEDANSRYEAGTPIVQ
ncbi:MAG: uroporphyrinogen decarboxylase family protein [Armatimonadota bacterium]